MENEKKKLTARQRSVGRLALDERQGGAFGHSVVDERVETLPSIHAGNDGRDVIVLKRQVAAVAAVPLCGRREAHRVDGGKWGEESKSLVSRSESVLIGAPSSSTRPNTRHKMRLAVV